MNERPFNAVVCRSGPCAGTSGQLLERLRAATRSCPHGVLISAGCVLGAARCRTAPGHDSGAYLFVQPCDLDRQPLGTAIGVAVARWLADGTLDIQRLEGRLRFAPGSAC